ncbi:MAG: hypothetical protein LBI18_04585 [Planctomycetaceae bacterium]|jgi:hypothetical protein|nr:hypothetical protein [Planctomycetaceae bacterium]
MSIDITRNYQNNSSTGQGQSTETSHPETLKAMFVVAMQNSLTNRMLRSNTSIVDINVTIQDSIADRQEQQNKDQHKTLQKNERHDFSKENKRTLNQSEIRQEQLNDDYARKIERHENLQTEYREKKECHDFINEQKIDRPTTPALETNSSIPVTTILTIPPDSVSETLSVLSKFPDRQLTVSSQEPDSVPITPGMIPPSFLTAASNPISVSASSVTQPVASLQNSATPITMLDAVSVMTIFTASGRFGISKEKNEDENILEKKKEKTKDKKGIIPLFVSGFVETTQPLMDKNQPTDILPDLEPETNNNSVQKITEENDWQSEQKSELKFGQELESKQELERESESDENRTTIPLEQLVREGQAVENSVVKSNELESFDSLRFIQRVAAACQSAANQQGVIRIKLHLDQLGVLTLRIIPKSNKLAIRFEVTSFSAVRCLRDTLGELHTTLAKQNILLEHTEIAVV